MALMRSSFIVSLGMHAGIVATVLLVAGIAGQPPRRPARITVATNDAVLAMPAAEQATLSVRVEPLVEQDALPELPLLDEPVPEAPSTEAPQPLADAVWITPARPPMGQESAAWRVPAVAAVPIEAAMQELPRPEPRRAAPDESVAVLAPEPGTNVPPDYPPLARRRGWQGSVLLLVVCDERGTVTTARVVRSSGRRILDEAAVAAVLQWRFLNGPGSIEQPIEFRLQG